MRLAQLLHPASHAPPLRQLLRQDTIAFPKRDQLRPARRDTLDHYVFVVWWQAAEEKAEALEDFFCAASNVQAGAGQIGCSAGDVEVGATCRLPTSPRTAVSSSSLSSSSQSMTMAGWVIVVSLDVKALETGPRMDWLRSERLSASPSAEGLFRRAPLKLRKVWPEQQPRIGEGGANTWRFLNMALRNFARWLAGTRNLIPRAGWNSGIVRRLLRAGDVVALERPLEMSVSIPRLPILSRGFDRRGEAYDRWRFLTFLLFAGEKVRSSLLPCCCSPVIVGHSADHDRR